MSSESKSKYAKMLTRSAESPIVYTPCIALRSKSDFRTECAHVTNEIMPGIQRLLSTDYLIMYGC